MLSNLSALFTVLTVAGICLAIPTPRGVDAFDGRGSFCLKKLEGKGPGERCLGWRDDHLVLLSFEDAEKYTWKEWAWGYHDGRSMSTGMDKLNGWEIWLAPRGTHGLAQDWTWIKWQGKNKYILVPDANENYVIDVRNGVTEIGSHLQMWDRTYGRDNPNQIWYLRNK